MIRERPDKNKPLSLYLHFPFCARKCRYCDFLSFPAGEDAREMYVQRLLEEIALRGKELSGRPVRTVFIGGGTPSLMNAGQLSRIMEAVCRYFAVEDEAEISMECNPGTVGGSSAITFADMLLCGINRLSLGLQSADDAELALLGRIHTREQFLDNYRAAREAGFSNINIDLMSGLPGQDRSSWMRTLETAADLKPEHISAYSLIIEEGTPFGEIYHEDSQDSQKRKKRQPDWPPLPDEETEREMYRDTAQLLESRGYAHYEISNYAEPGYECRHNLTYWYRGEYLGLGLGAASLVQERRFSNTRDLTEYMERGTDFPVSIEALTPLSVKEQMEETMFLGLRCAAGVGRREFYDRFGRDLEEIYGDVIRRYLSLGFLQETDHRIHLTMDGINVSNYILADFLL